VSIHKQVGTSIGAVGGDERNIINVSLAATLREDKDIGAKHTDGGAEIVRARDKTPAERVRPVTDARIVLRRIDQLKGCALPVSGSGPRRLRLVMDLVHDNIESRSRARF